MANITYLCSVKNKEEMNANRVDVFKQRYKDADMITSNEIKAFCRDIKNNRYLKDKIAIINNPVAVSNNYITGFVRVLKSKGVITPLKRGIYTLNAKKSFQPEIDKHLKKIHKIFIEKYPEISYCVWSSNVLHTLMNLQPFNHFYIIETEKDILNSVFYLLKENNINAFLNPDKGTAEKYMAESKNSVVVKPFITRTPFAPFNKIKTASLEKILVDIFCDTDIFFYYQGNELKNIFSNAFRYYQIDYSKFLNYAVRRNQKTKLIKYIKDNNIFANLTLLK